MQSTKTKKIVLVGGSTAGHILPLLEVKSELLKKGKFRFLYIGEKSQIEDRLLAGKTLKRKIILCGKFRRDRSAVAILRNIVDFFLVIIGTIQSFVILSSYKPELIFSKSGYVCVPVAFAARLLSIPVVIHESDVVAGLATRICAFSSHAILTAFPSAIYSEKVRRKAIYAGLPVRTEFENAGEKSEEYILVFGGSQGASEINERIRNILPELLVHHKVIHLTGAGLDKEYLHFKQQLEPGSKKNYEVKSYEPDMNNLMRRAKLVISRAGATTIFEIAALGKKSLLVPITSGVASHQVSNALFLEEYKMAVVVSPSDGAKELLEKINKLLDSKTDKTIENLFFHHSATYISRLIIDYIDYYSLRKLKNIFMIGIGGVSMRGIAEILKTMGINVNGSDLKTGGHNKKNINISYDLVVYSSAADERSQAKPEHEKARELNIPIIKRSQMVGWLMKGSKGISVSGMHGKTTVSSLIAEVLGTAGLDPSFLIGAPRTEKNTSSHLGSGIDFVSEACEYDGSFLDFNTTIAVITNIEKEHLDYFKGGLEQIMEEFSRFVQTVHPGGAIIYCHDDPRTCLLIDRNKKHFNENKIQTISYGFSKGSDHLISSYEVKDLRSHFTIDNVELSSGKVGEFFALNCAAAFAVSKYIGVGVTDITRAIFSFRGAPRRFEYLGEKDGVKVFDDYGHHPTEIKKTLKALSEQFPKNRKIIIFEPHQQKRFNDFYDQFVEALKDAPVDYIGILPVYKVPGRDEKEEKSVDDLVKQANNPKIIPLENYEVATNFIEENLKKGDILMTMGATDIFKVARNFLNR